MRFLVKRNSDGEYVFGNKTFTSNVKQARKFNTHEEAESHIDSWFNPAEYTAEYIADPIVFASAEDLNQPCDVTMLHAVIMFGVIVAYVPTTKGQHAKISS